MWPCDYILANQIKQSVADPSFKKATQLIQALCPFFSEVFFPAGWNADVTAGAQVAILSKAGFGQRGSMW